MWFAVMSVLKSSLLGGVEAFKSAERAVPSSLDIVLLQLRDRGVNCGEYLALCDAGW